MGIGIAVFPASYNGIVHLLPEGLDGNIGSLAKIIIAIWKQYYFRLLIW